jgi:hypothetical protein
MDFTNTEGFVFTFTFSFDFDDVEINDESL